MSDFSFNPFYGLWDSQIPENPHARTKRTSLGLKIQHTFRVFAGNMGFFDEHITSNKAVIDDESSTTVTFGINDYLLIGAIFKGCAALVYKMFLQLTDYNNGFVGSLFLILFIIAFFSIALATGIVHYTLALAETLIATLVGVLPTHIISSIASYQDKQLVGELFASGLLQKDGEHFGSLSKSSTAKLVRTLCEDSNRGKTYHEGIRLLKNRTFNTRYTLDETVIPPGQFCLFKDRLTPQQKANLKYTHALERLNLLRVPTR